MSAGFAFIAWRAAAGAPVADTRPLFAVFAAISLFVLGFLLMAQALLHENESRTLIQNLRKTGHYEVLLRDLRVTTGADCVALAIPLIGFLAAEGAARYAVACTVGSSVFMLIEFWFSGRKFSRVMADFKN